MKNVLGKVGYGISYPFRRIYHDIVDTWKGITKENISISILLLVVVNVVALLVSNIIAARSFELGTLNNGIRFALPIAVIIYPIVISISDILSQKAWIWTRRSAHLGFILNLFMVIAFQIAITATGGKEGDFAILFNSWYLLIASFLSFYLGDLIDDLVFKHLRNKDDEKGDSKGKLLKRCVLSTVAGQIIDASIFIILGMHVFPLLCGDASLMSNFMTGNVITDISDPIGWANVGIMIGLQIGVKVLYEFILSPLIIWICKPNKNKQIKEN